MKRIIEQLKKEIREELTADILPFWMERMQDSVHGGFYGRISGNNELHAEAEKGAVLNARLLWTFSAAYRLLGKNEYLEMATRAKSEIIDRFYDAEYGGVYWSLDSEGFPLDTKKQIYALGFAVYGLSEYYRATGDEDALNYAVRLFHDIEKHSFDAVWNGYCEAMTREWNEIDDMRLSEKDANERKTMNTHLHILEPYTNLYRVWKNPELEKQLRNLIRLFIDKILNKQTYHLQLFFDDQWNNKHNIISYGHDIEASWLLHEAALVLGDDDLLAEVESYVVAIAHASFEGYFPGAGMIYELHQDISDLDAERHWWVQAENIVGNINLYQHFGDLDALHRAVDCWQFVKKYLVDNIDSEWYWSIRADGSINKEKDKAGFWKCPYHNGRMCLEIIERFDN